MIKILYFLSRREMIGQFKSAAAHNVLFNFKLLIMYNLVFELDKIKKSVM